MEEGDATQQGLEWIYTTQAQNSQLSGSKITITAMDYAGNTTEKEEKIV